MSIWCSWGSNDYCRPGEAPGVVLTPSVLLDSWCFAKPPISSTAACSTELTQGTRATRRVVDDPLRYSIGFHSAMRIFAGTDVVRSVQIMRLANVLLAVTLLFWALWTAERRGRFALAFSWGLVIVPVGIFYIASVNPSSWAISGIGTYWIFLWTLLSRLSSGPTSLRPWQITGTVFALFVAILARLDSILYLALVTAALLVAHPIGRQLFRRKSFVALLIPIAAIIGVFVMLNVQRWSPNFVWPGAQLTRDMPTPWIKTALEFPSIFFGVFGGQEASWIQRETGVDRVSEGYTAVGFMHGIGWPDVVMPSAVGLITGGFALFVIMNSLRVKRKRFAVGIALLLGSCVALFFISRAAFNFGTGFQMQARYLFPLALALVGLCSLPAYGGRAKFSRLQLSVMTIFATVSGSLAWLATVARYSIGQDAAFTNFGQEVSWWWFDFPGRLASFWIVGVVTAMWCLSALWSFRQVDASSGRSDASSILRQNSALN